MAEMLEFLLLLLVNLSYIFMSAFFIKYAIVFFKQSNYLMFGFSLIMAIYNALQLAALIFEF